MSMHGPISSSVYEFITPNAMKIHVQISWQFHTFLFNQFLLLLFISHMLRQDSCQDMCKIMMWFDHWDLKHIKSQDVLATLIMTRSVTDYAHGMRVELSHILWFFQWVIVHMHILLIIFQFSSIQIQSNENCHWSVSQAANSCLGMFITWQNHYIEGHEKRCPTHI